MQVEVRWFRQDGQKDAILKFPNVERIRGTTTVDLWTFETFGCITIWPPATTQAILWDGQEIRVVA